MHAEFWDLERCRQLLAVLTDQMANCREPEMQDIFMRVLTNLLPHYIICNDSPDVCVIYLFPCLMLKWFRWTSMKNLVDGKE